MAATGYAVDTAVLQQFLRAGATVDAADNDGMTALMHAVQAGSVEHASILLSHDADVTLRNAAGQTPADLPARSTRQPASPVRSVQTVRGRKVRRKCYGRTQPVLFLDWQGKTGACQDAAMQKYKQYCPVARASEILADRWTPLIVRELILGSHRFNEIERGLPGISRSLLSSRLRDLEDAGVIERLPGAQPKAMAYHLSEAGRDLKPLIEALGAWGVRWAFGEPRPEELDAGLLIWRIHQRINRQLLPERRTVVEFDFTGPRGRRVWLLLEPREVSVCVTPPGFDSDLIVRADLAFFYRVWLGHIEYETAIRCRSVVVEGAPALAKQLPRWFLWSPMARFVREREHTMAQVAL